MHVGDLIALNVDLLAAGTWQLQTVFDPRIDLSSRSFRFQFVWVWLPEALVNVLRETFLQLMPSCDS